MWPCAAEADVAVAWALLDGVVGTRHHGCAPVLAAYLLLLRCAFTGPEMLCRMFSLKPLPVAAMTEQLTRSMPLLFRAVGYAGWCLCSTRWSRSAVTRRYRALSYT